MLDRYVDGERVENDDELFLRDLLDLHPEAAAKIGCGVSHFTREADGRGGRCVWLWRTDGTHSDWSPGKALRLSGARHDLLGALRCEVRISATTSCASSSPTAQPSCALSQAPR